MGLQSVAHLLKQAVIMLMHAESPGSAHVGYRHIPDKRWSPILLILHLACGQITLDHWPEGFAALAFDTMIASSGHMGAGFELRDNVIMNNRGRGMLIKAGNGDVEGNTIIRPVFWPVQVLTFFVVRIF